MEVRISQYADDLIVFTDTTLTSVKGALEDISYFSQISGLSINIEKTKCMPIGKEHAIFLHDSSIGIQFVDEIKILGILFNPKNDNITALNMENILQSLPKQIAQWKRRNLTLIRKITVIKSLILSRFVHLFLALPNPSATLIKRLNSLLYRFIWNSADKVKRSRLTQSYGRDGLQMVEVSSFIQSLKASWLQRLGKSDSIWAKIAKCASTCK